MVSAPALTSLSGLLPPKLPWNLCRGESHKTKKLSIVSNIFSQLSPVTNACRSLDPVLLQGRRCQYSADYACAIVLVISCNLVVFFVAFVIFLGTASFPCCHLTILTMWTSMSI